MVVEAWAHREVKESWSAEGWQKQVTKLGGEGESQTFDFGSDSKTGVVFILCGDWAVGRWIGLGRWWTGLVVGWGFCFGLKLT